MKRTELVIFFVIMAIALVVRLERLPSVPPGLSQHEAINGNNAETALTTGNYSLFYPDDNGREGLFINVQAASVSVLGNSVFALRVVSALIGVFTVLGVYLLTRRMFDDWRLAALAGFLMAVGFWHIAFSRIGTGAILAPLTAVWGFYYLYKGIETHRLWHWAMAGIWFGLGFHASAGFRVIPLAVACTLGALWLSLSAVFSHGKYQHARHQMLGGFSVMVGVLILLLLPMVPYFYSNPLTLAGSESLSVRGYVSAAGKTFGMFFFNGDNDWAHGIPGVPVLYWPVAAFFSVGLLHTAWRFVHSWRMRGHPGVVQTLLLSWFVVGLIPAVFAFSGTPNAMRILLVSPAVYIIAAVGLHWLFLSLERWYGHDDIRKVCLPLRHLPGSWGHRVCIDRSTLVVSIALFSVLFATGIGDIRRYFVDWAESPAVAAQFSPNSAELASRLLSLPPSTLKYVVTSGSGTAIGGISDSAQPLMFLTGTTTPEQQREKNIFYLTPEQFRRHEYPKGALVFQLSSPQ